MPIREFRCSDCGSVFETLILSKSDETGQQCPKCRGRKLTAMFSVFGVAGAEKRVSVNKGCATCAAYNCSTCT